MGRAMMGTMAVHAVSACDAGLQRRWRAVMAVIAVVFVDLADDVGAGMTDLTLWRMFDGGMIAAAGMP